MLSILVLYLDAFALIVAHADIYCALYNARGEVIEDMGDEVWVAWEHWQDKPKKNDRYFKDELRLL
ncbi:hypothetical protein H6G14_31425 [Nostoc parmelioides FACHB-3921]|uniref:Uncharacterized protein n=1 Tax=Nostoc parmelioides FACHB-3921 TaxID=2692909 RepID=A0ABR8BNJ0_9NOSO|nr:hypothetical protein [Nostoc parmelioides FACHB-3921]